MNLTTLGESGNASINAVPLHTLVPLHDELRQDFGIMIGRHPLLNVRDRILERPAAFQAGVLDDPLAIERADPRLSKVGHDCRLIAI